MADITEHACPYKILGVNEDADSEEIKKQFRYLSKKHHPDVGGDSKTYARITWAYSILKDVEKRARYDKGEGTTVHTDEQKAYVLIGNIFTELLNKKSDKIFYVDVVENVEDIIDNGIKKMESELDKLYKEKSRLTKLRTRFKCEDKRTNIFENVLNQRLSTIKTRVRNIEAEKKQYQLALELLEYYEFEKMAQQQTSSSYKIHFWK